LAPIIDISWYDGIWTRMRRCKLQEYNILFTSMTHAAHTMCLTKLNAWL